ncbi:unnamed protein product [Periconia digitata]|uniref:Uncharacterized protein n=1 Tax=Periconia digitata TaxID=1303443 RepID=A0A9W4UKN3_9PLEO|nr:unnamed protein product [Periconia digitata]
MALYRISTLLALVFFLYHTTASAIKRDAANSQIRFVGCMNNKVRAITYNDWAPQPGQIPDDWLLVDDKQSSFLAGSQLEGNSILRKTKWKVQTQQHGWESETFKSFIGTATYGNEGFNCFQDDAHAVFLNFFLGNCYTEIYCTHQEARNLTITASTDVVELATNVTAEEIISHAPERLEKQSMNTNPVKIDKATIPFSPGTECFISYEGKGTNEDLKALIRVLTEIIGKEPALFKYEVDKHNGACVCLNPNSCVCKDPYYTGHLTMPRKYTLVTTNNPPPLSNENPGPGAWLEATVSCASPTEDSSLCKALKTGLKGTALIPGVSQVFESLLWSANVACSH